MASNSHQSTPSLILASTSIHRKKILDQVGLSYEALAPTVDEREVEKDFSQPIEQLAEFLSLQKAQSIQKQKVNSVIIGSDQVLIFNGKKLDKPKSLDEVHLRLAELQGQTHILSTGLCVLKGEKIWSTTVDAKMKMVPLTETQSSDYAPRDQAVGCAGGYTFEQGGPIL
ncbi:MAG: Maf family protein, partial [Pseudomonadota bacterium]